MKQSFINYLKPILISFILIACLLIVNTVMQMGFYFGRIHPYAEVAFYVVIGYVFLKGVFIPFFGVLWAKSQKKIELNPESERYRQKAVDEEIKRLKNFPNVVFIDVDDELSKEDKIRYAYQKLEEGGVEIIRKYSRNVFFSTAISQNGHLDAMFVMVNQFKMVKEIVHHYGLKPSAEGLLKLYSNVFVSVLGAEAISDQEISTIISNVSTSSSLSNIPGLTGISNILTNSLLQGTGNGILTLRVGYITLAYLDIEKKDRKTIRHNATVRALQTLPALMTDVAKSLISIFGKATWGQVKRAGNAVSEATIAAGESVVEVSKKTVQKVSDLANSASEAAGEALSDVAKKATDITTETSHKTKSFFGKLNPFKW